jgi:hypothetical protein
LAKVALMQAPENFYPTACSAVSRNQVGKLARMMPMNVSFASEALPRRQRAEAEGIATRPIAIKAGIGFAQTEPTFGQFAAREPIMKNYFPTLGNTLLIRRLFGIAVGGILGYVMVSLSALFIGGLIAQALNPGGQGPGDDSLKWIGMIVGGLGGAFMGAFIAGRPIVARWCIASALVVGGLAFLGGFVGPILLSPNLPQGPLLGILCTGPLGFVLGAIVGFFVGLWKERQGGSIPTSDFRLKGIRHVRPT